MLTWLLSYCLGLFLCCFVKPYFLPKPRGAVPSPSFAKLFPQNATINSPAKLDPPNPDSGILSYCSGCLGNAHAFHCDTSEFLAVLKSFVFLLLNPVT